MALVEMTHPHIEGHGWIDEEAFPDFALKGWTRVDAPAPTDAEHPRTKPARRPAVATTHSEKE